MSSSRYDIGKTDRQSSPIAMSVVRTTAKEAKFVPGRRVEIKYQDLGLAEATNGDMRAQLMHIGDVGESRPTGWHYHTCDVQFLHMIKGWLKIELPGQGVILLEEGDSITIPGGVVHQELAASNPVELLEVTLPAKLQTVNVPAPEGAQEVASGYGEISVPRDV